MEPLRLSIGEPFKSPAWGSNFAVFSGEFGRPVPEPEMKDYIARCCKYARHYEVYLVPERFILLGYHSMCLISPAGKVLGAQKALHWNLARKQGKRGDILEVFDTGFGGVSLLVDVDVYHPEVPRTACLLGARFAICSQQIDGGYESHQVVNGVWNAAQSNHLFVAAASNAFNCVAAPRVLTKYRDGFLAGPAGKMPVTAKCNAADLDRVPARFCLSRRLYAVHREELVR